MKALSAFIVLLGLLSSQEEPPLFCLSSNSTLCDTICSIRYSGLKNHYDLENKECAGCGEGLQCDQSSSNLGIQGLIDDPEIVCVNGEFFKEYGQCICNEGWFDRPKLDEDVVYKCDTQSSPYNDSIQQSSPSVWKKLVLILGACIIGISLGLLLIFLISRCSSLFSRQPSLEERKGNTSVRSSSVLVKQKQLKEYRL